MKRVLLNNDTSYKHSEYFKISYNLTSLIFKEISKKIKKTT
jgi:hypothetical protein